MNRVIIEQPIISHCEVSQNEIVDAALRYARMGWPVLPCAGKNPNVLGADWQRKATSDERTIQRWYSTLERADNVGVLTGAKFFVLDIDKKHDGYASLDDLTREYGTLPDTLQQISGGGGRHYFFAIPDGEVIRSCKIRPGVEIKGYHGFLVLEPSVHPDTGERYVFDGADEIEHQPILPAPEWLLKIIRQGGEHRKSGKAAEVIPSVITKGTQHDTLVSLAGSMRARGCNAEEIFAALQVTNAGRCEEPGAEENVRRIADSFMKYPPNKARQGEISLKREHEAERVRELATVEDRAAVQADPLYRAPGGKLALSPTTGRPERTLFNAISALMYAPHWNGKLAYNEFTMRIMAGEALCGGAVPAGAVIGDDEIVKIMSYMQGMDDVHVSIELICKAVRDVAKSNASHPVRNYLSGLIWDKTERCGTWLVQHLGAQDSEYTRTIGTRWLVSAVARIMQPGCKADSCLVLEGPQGIGKSSALRTLAGNDWFSDSFGDVTNKDTLLGFRGKWIIEIGEIERIFIREASIVKDFISKQIDNYRPPYGRESVDVPREFIFAGTTNHNDYLRDETGGRRFWPIGVTRADTNALRDQRDQIWAEAVHLYNAGERWWVDACDGATHEQAEREQRRRYEEDPWQEAVMAFCDRRKGESIQATNVLVIEIGKKLADITKADRNRVAKILVGAGYVKRTSWVDGRSTSAFVKEC